MMCSFMRLGTLQFETKVQKCIRMGITIFKIFICLTEEIWAKLKTGLLKTTEEVCGTTKPHRWRRETWWWNKEVDDAITAKLSKHGRLANAHEHHITLPSASPDVWCTMHATKQTRWSMRALTTSRLISSASPTR